MEKRFYRIIEHNGKFTIQVYWVKTHGYLWWKKYVGVFSTANVFGGEKIQRPFLTPCLSFNSLEDALNQIKLWRTIPKVVYTENP